MVLGQHGGSICTPVISQVSIKIPAETVPLSHMYVIHKMLVHTQWNNKATEYGGAVGAIHYGLVHILK